MNVSYFFAALGGATLLWFFLIRRLRAKPWLEAGLIELDYGATTVPAAKIGLWVFLVVVTSLFALFIVGYNQHSAYASWRPLSEPQLLWANTVFLVLGSLALQRARSSLIQENIEGAKLSLSAGGGFTIVFILGQLFAWRELRASGHFMTTNPADGFFYLLTALHGLHLLGGLWVWTNTTARVWRGFELSQTTEIAQAKLSVQLCSVYWHYLLLLWFVLFGLLLST